MSHLSYDWDYTLQLKKAKTKTILPQREYTHPKKKISSLQGHESISNKRASNFQKAKQFQQVKITDAEGESFNFFGLPKEVRDSIYAFVLVPEQPIEFAPLQVLSDGPPHLENCFPVHRNSTYPGPSYYTPKNEYEENPWGHYSGATWHEKKYKTLIQPSLKLLRVSKQVWREAAPIYYGQEFRFSNSQGWHLLHTWLNLIKPSNQHLLRNITVTYPGVTALHDSEVHGAKLSIYDRRIREVRLSPIPTPVSQTAPGSHELPKGWTASYRKWVKKSDPTILLRSLPQLRTLRFTMPTSSGYSLFVNGFLSDDGDAFVHGLTHPIYQVDWSAHTKLQISMINLISIYGGRNQEVESAVLLAGLPHPNYSDHCYPWHVVPEYYLQQAQKFFRAIKKAGCKIEDMCYDNHYTYPTEILQHCTDRDICKYVEEIAEEAKSQVGRLRARAGCGKWIPEGDKDEN